MLNLRHINYLNILLTISGIQPVYDRPKNGRKYSILGLIFVTIHGGLILYCDYTLQEEQQILRLLLTGIMLGMSYLQRIANLAYPLATLIGTIVQFKSMARFLELEDRFDLYLMQQCSLDVSGMHRRIKKMQMMSMWIAIIIGIVSAYSHALYSKAISPMFNDADFTGYYTGLFFGMNFTLVIFKICNHYFALSLRSELYIRHLKNILRSEIHLNLPVKRY